VLKTEPNYGLTPFLVWVAERLGMGHESRVSQAVARMTKRPGRRLARLGRLLEELEVGDGRKRNSEKTIIKGPTPLRSGPAGGWRGFGRCWRS